MLHGLPAGCRPPEAETRRGSHSARVLAKLAMDRVHPRQLGIPRPTLEEWAMTHPLVLQLRFTRKEFMRGLEGLGEADAQKSILPMNCISWYGRHLAWQEQRDFLCYPQNQLPFPQINEAFAYGAPASTPTLGEVRAAWAEITEAAERRVD